MTLMVALVGEQPQPNFLAVLHCQPSDVLLLYTQRTKPVYERLEATLQQMKTTERKQIIVHGLETDPYDIAIIVKALNYEIMAGVKTKLNLPSPSHNTPSKTSAHAL